MELPDELKAKLDEHMKQVPRIESIDAVLDVYYHLSEAHKYAQCGEETYLENEEKQAAIMFRLLCAGEAAKQFCDLYEGKNRKDKSRRLDQPNDDIEKIPVNKEQWQALHKLRDALAHNPTESKAPESWKFITQDVPPLLPVFRRIVMHYTPEQLKNSLTPARLRAIEVINGEFVAAFESAISQFEGNLVKLEEKYPGIKEEAEKWKAANPGDN